MANKIIIFNKYKKNATLAFKLKNKSQILKVEKIVRTFPNVLAFSYTFLETKHKLNLHIVNFDGHKKSSQQLRESKSYYGF